MGNPGAQIERRFEVEGVGSRVVCSIVKQKANELSKDQEYGDATITGEHGEITISDEQIKNILDAFIHSKVIEHECDFDEKTGVSVRIIDGKTVKVNEKLMKETLETRRKQGREIKTRRGPSVKNMNIKGEKEEGPEI